MEPTIVKFVGSYICYGGPDFMKAVQSMNPVMICTQGIQMVSRNRQLVYCGQIYCSCSKYKSFLPILLLIDIIENNAERALVYPGSRKAKLKLCCRQSFCVYRRERSC